MIKRLLEKNITDKKERGFQEWLHVRTSKDISREDGERDVEERLQEMEEKEKVATKVEGGTHERVMVKSRSETGNCFS